MSYAHSAITRTPKRTLTVTLVGFSSTNRSVWQPTGTSYYDQLRARIKFPQLAACDTGGQSLAVALFIRLFSLTDIPPNLVPDEAENLITVYRIMADIGPGFFELDWKPQPAFSVYMMGWFMGFFGGNHRRNAHGKRRR